MQSIIEQAVSEVLDRALPGLRAEVVRRASEQLQGAAPVHGASQSEKLDAATASIQGANSQAEILRQLLESSARFARRVALFVAKGGVISGWEGTGFNQNEFLKSISLNGSSGLVAQAMQTHQPASGKASEFDAPFLSAAGQPADDHCMVLPLTVKEKVAGLIYADAGPVSGVSVDASALGVLTRCAGLWLEVVALRKTDAVTAEEPFETAAASAAAVATSAPSAAPPAIASATQPAAGDPDLHRKAKRFAKLLVEEIKLYNQPKVTEGRHQRDLYERLKEDIEKSRATYDKRYGESSVASANYFTEELIRILAENDVTLMGASFPR